MKPQSSPSRASITSRPKAGAAAGHAAAPAWCDGIDGKSFQNAKGKDMLGTGVDIGSTATKIAVLDEGGAVVDMDVRPRHYSPSSAATSPIFSRLSTKSAMSAADCSHTKTRSRLSMATSFTMPALTSWRIASFVAP